VLCNRAYLGARCLWGYGSIEAFSDTVGCSIDLQEYSLMNHEYDCVKDLPQQYR
jgi:hypothetical protein